LADGRVHTGQTAAELGLTDGVRSLDQAMAELVSLTRRGTSSKGRLKMKEDHVEDVAAKAATPAELKASLPNADPGFLFAQIERGATIADAREAYADAREARIAEQEAALEESKKAASKPEPAKAPAQKPISDNMQVEEATFESLVTELRDKGLSRRDACLSVAKQYPELHADFLDRCPRGRTLSSELR